MPEIPEYISTDRRVEVTVQLPDGTKETFNSQYDYVVFIDLRKDGVWIRDENNTNFFYPESQILELKMPSSDARIPDNLQKQRRH